VETIYPLKVDNDHQFAMLTLRTNPIHILTSPPVQQRGNNACRRAHKKKKKNVFTNTEGQDTSGTSFSTKATTNLQRISYSKGIKV
jgi:hypothetical protein